MLYRKYDCFSMILGHLFSLNRRFLATNLKINIFLDFYFTPVPISCPHNLDF